MSYTKTALSIFALITLLIAIYVDVPAAAVLAFAGMIVIGILKYINREEQPDSAKNSKPARAAAQKKPVPSKPKPLEKLPKPGVSPPVKAQRPRALPTWKMPPRR